MILGMSGLEKLGLEISISKSYVCPVETQKKGILLKTENQLEMNLLCLSEGALLLCDTRGFHLCSVETTPSV